MEARKAAPGNVKESTENDNKVDNTREIKGMRKEDENLNVPEEEQSESVKLMEEGESRSPAEELQNQRASTDSSSINRLKEGLVKRITSFEKTLNKNEEEISDQIYIIFLPLNKLQPLQPFKNLADSVKFMENCWVCQNMVWIKKR